jgi:hypothetical protein
LYDDAERRDFTINALAEDEDGNIVDFFNGLEDLKNKVLDTPDDINLMPQSKRQRRKDEKQKDNNILIVRKPYNPDTDDVDFFEEYNLKLYNSGMKEIDRV